MTVDFGQCWGTPNGQDLSMPSYMASGNLVVAEAVLRRWTTSRGQLLDDPNYGFNLTDMIGDDLSPSDVTYAQQQLAQEAAKDERVYSCSVVLTLVAGLASAVASVNTAAGPFRFVVAVSATTTSLLLVTS